MRNLPWCPPQGPPARFVRVFRGPSCVAPPSARPLPPWRSLPTSTRTMAARVLRTASIRRLDRCRLGRCGTGRLRGRPRCCLWATLINCPGRSWTGPDRHHRFACGPGGAADRGVPASRSEPDHRQRPSDQPRPDAEWEAQPGSDFYFIASDEREEVVNKILTVVKEHSAAVRAAPDPRHPGALSDEPQRDRRPGAQHELTGSTQARRAQCREVWLALRGRRLGDADRERLRGPAAFEPTTPWFVGGQGAILSLINQPLAALANAESNLFQSHLWHTQSELVTVRDGT